MNIRFAIEKDIPRINQLLLQVAAIHHKGRPDLFRPSSRKYTDEELKTILSNPLLPVLVATDDTGYVLGYAFCQFQQHTESQLLTDIRTLYIDDLCVDQSCRGQHIGHSLYHAVLSLARQEGCYNVTLNVWSCNTSAMRFYEHCGLKPQKVGLEQIL